MDEKKKLMIVGALVAVIACVGAFQFLGGPPPPAPAAPAGASKPKVEQVAMATGASAIKNPTVADELAIRNPFSPPADALPPVIKPAMSSRPTPLPPVQHRLGGKFRPTLEPMPIAGGDLKGLSNPQPGAHPERLSDEKPFGYKVVGTIGGVRPAVMFEDSSGNEKLVPVGSAIDGDSRVRGVENGAVMIEHRGQKLRMTVGGNPSGK